MDGEDRVIATLLAATRAHGSAHLAARVGPGDDAAVLADGTALTVDALVEGVHWDHHLSPEDVGYKALAVSVSDLAGMGARPAWALLTLALPALDLEWVEAFSRGLALACARWDVALVGGDTVRTTGPRVVSLTLGGACVAAPMTRGGARPGDVVWVTGSPGLASLGWRLAEPPAEALEALRRPDPPLAFALDLATRGWASAAMDLSDGLERDLPRLCAASGVGAVLDVDRVARHRLLADDSWAYAVSGGDEYQLLFTAPAGCADDLRALADAHDVWLTPIGTCDDSGVARLGDRDWPRASFEHFGAHP